MQLSEGQMKLAILFVIVVVIAVGYVFWARSAPPAPVIGQGQSLHNPLGTGGPAGDATAREKAMRLMGPAPNARIPAGVQLPANVYRPGNAPAGR